MMDQEHLYSPDLWFTNRFQIEDLLIFDEETLRMLLTHQQFGITPQLLAWSIHL